MVSALFSDHDLILKDLSGRAKEKPEMCEESGEVMQLCEGNTGSVGSTV